MRNSLPARSSPRWGVTHRIVKLHYLTRDNARLAYLGHTCAHTLTRSRVQLVSVRQRKMQMTRHYVQQQRWQQSQQRSEN